MHDLPQPFGFGEVTQAVRAEVVERHGPLAGPHQRGGQVGDEDLAAVATAMTRAARLTGRPRKSSPPLHLAGVHAHPHLEADPRHGRARRDRRVHGGSAEVNAAAMPSPIVANSSPPRLLHGRAQHAKCCSTRSDIAGDSSHCRVDPSMSVKRNVTVAAGRSSVRRAPGVRALRRRAPLHRQPHRSLRPPHLFVVELQTVSTIARPGSTCVWSQAPTRGRRTWPNPTSRSPTAGGRRAARSRQRIVRAATARFVAARLRGHDDRRHRP